MSFISCFLYFSIFILLSLCLVVHIFLLSLQVLLMIIYVFSFDKFYYFDQAYAANGDGDYNDW